MMCVCVCCERREREEGESIYFQVQGSKKSLKPTSQVEWSEWGHEKDEPWGWRMEKCKDGGMVKVLARVCMCMCEQRKEGKDMRYV